ncbi:transporter substrate-binding domain-containing protein [Shewanella donghaensis]|uniref:transporter substrate-binding domain-containing protein n=1 Tax=Shewanella donghaensis TaxID=238836 RepID=UPI00118385D9|nr:transporter substrate-binding domain-containing protein [Shewanella donghaensis]
MLNNRGSKNLLNKLLLFCIVFLSSHTLAYDLKEVKKSGVLRHIGVPYANFVIQYPQDEKIVQDGLDVELMRGFAKYLGVEYQFVEASWGNLIGKINGQNASYVNQSIQLGTKVPIQGDVISNGYTILDWRSQLLDFSDVYFPSAVWLVARTDSTLQPIKSSGSVITDIQAVKSKLSGRTVLAMKQSCLDPDLYNMSQTEAKIILPVKARKLNEMVPAIINHDAESTLLDVPDTLIALQKWSDEIKVIGPISEEQRMAVAFRKNSPELRTAFNTYLEIKIGDGSYLKLVKKYYPDVFYFYPKFFMELEY